MNEENKSRSDPDNGLSDSLFSKDKIHGLHKIGDVLREIFKEK